MKKLIVSAEGAEPAHNNLDALRLFLALLVVWSHSFAIHLGSERTEWVSMLLNGAYNAGNLAVMGFFVISGYLISQSYQRSSSVKSYMKRRVRRIYPGFLVAVAICTFVVIPLFATHWVFSPETIGEAAGRNLLLQGYFPPSDAFATDVSAHTVNGSLWSIKYEFWCYIGVVMLGVASLLTRRSFLVALTAFCMFAQLAMDVTGKLIGFGVIDEFIGWPYLWTKMLPCFLLGMVAYAYRHDIPGSRALLLCAIVWAIALCWISPHIGPLIVPPALAYSLFYVGFSENIRLHGAAKYGDFSYGTYLYAFTIQLMLQATIGRNWNLATFFVVSSLLALAAGILSWHLVERWFMPRKVPRSGRSELGGALQVAIGPSIR